MPHLLLSDDESSFERLVAELSATFVNLAPDEVDQRIEAALAAVVEALALDRSTLSQLADDGGLVATHSWAASGLAPALGIRLHEETPWLARRVMSGRTTWFADPSDLPAEARGAVAWSARLGIQSHASVPMSVGERVLGGLHVASSRRVDLEPALPRLELLAQIFGGALDRKRADLRLRAALAEVERLKAALERENVLLREQLRSDSEVHVVGDSPALRTVLDQAARVAAADSTVLLLGETGTGKDLMARMIHQASPRRERSLVEIDCTVLPATLIESELFGHEKGAFSGANRSRPGRFEMADGGTLFLDEVGELSLDLQAKLLRALESGEISRLGSTTTERVDVRLIAATNRDLEAEVARGTFRRDLYYRISVFPLALPPLRDRREDVPLLVWHFVDLLGHRLGKRVERVSESAMEALVAYEWPGNVRELRNIVERSMLLSAGTTLEVELPGPTRGDLRPPTESLDDVEREHVRKVLAAAGGRIKGPGGAAKRLGLKPSTLYSRLKKLGIER